MQVGGRSERTIDSCTNDSEVNEYLVTAKSIGKLLTFIQAARLERSPASWPCGVPKRTPSVVIMLFTARALRVEYGRIFSSAFTDGF